MTFDLTRLLFLADCYTLYTSQTTVFNYSKLLRRVQLIMELHLRATGCLFPYGITHCYLPLEQRCPGHKMDAQITVKVVSKTAIIPNTRDTIFNYIRQIAIIAYLVEVLSIRNNICYHLRAAEIQGSSSRDHIFMNRFCIRKISGCTCV